MANVKIQALFGVLVDYLWLLLVCDEIFIHHAFKLLRLCYYLFLRHGHVSVIILHYFFVATRTAMDAYYSLPKCWKLFEYT